jgi:hypothetical protein
MHPGQNVLHPSAEDVVVVWALSALQSPDLSVAPKDRSPSPHAASEPAERHTGRSQGVTNCRAADGQVGEVAASQAQLAGISRWRMAARWATVRPTVGVLHRSRLRQAVSESPESVQVGWVASSVRRL